MKKALFASALALVFGSTIAFAAPATPATPATPAVKTSTTVTTATPAKPAAVEHKTQTVTEKKVVTQKPANKHVKKHVKKHHVKKHVKTNRGHHYAKGHNK